MKQLFIIRHGQCLANAELKVCGRIDSPLTELGRKQAALCGQNVKRFFAPVDVIFTSPLSRSLDTAKIIASAINLDQAKIIIIDNLKERDLGAVDGQGYTHPPLINGNVQNLEGSLDLEPIGDFYIRVNKALQKIKTHQFNQGLIVCHNGTGRMLQNVAKKDQPLAMYQQPRLENAVIYRLAPTLPN